MGVAGGRIGAAVAPRLFGASCKSATVMEWDAICRQSRPWEIIPFDAAVWVLICIFQICTIWRKNRLFDRRKRALQRTVVHAGQSLGQLGLHFRHFLRACRLAFRPESRYCGSYRPAVVRIFDAQYQAVRLEPVHELRDVGAHAGHFLGAFAQIKRLACFHEMRQRPELRKRQPNPRQSFIQALLDGTPGVYDGEHQLTVILTLAATPGTDMFHT